VKKKIGFMGLGIMGTAMAENILKDDWRLTVYNRTRNKTSILEELGAGVAESPKALAEASDVVIAMVTGPEAVLNLLSGEDGAAAGMTGDKVFVNMSTISPAYAREINHILGSHGVTYVDSPVLGTKGPAEKGELVVLAGGDREVVDELEPLYMAMGKKVVYCGEVGKGSMMKMSVNLLLGTMLEGLAEMLHFGMAGGLEKKTLLDVVMAGPLACKLFELKAEMMQTESFPVQFPLKHMAKDLKFAVDTAYETGAPAPSAHGNLQLYRRGAGQGFGDMDFAAIYKVLEAMAAK
jgi:3-hydroxyisobutyrate dehydrogenase-like beta-hydroxyacid dehydrogenase